MLSTIKETKHNLDGATVRFDCYLLYHDPDYLVLCYMSDKAYAVAEADLPPGSLTVGHYWRDTDYIVWEMYNPRAEFQGYYMHICRNLAFGENSVEWHDMVVDVWFGADGCSEILDEDELERSVRAGHIGRSEADIVCQRARELRANLPSIAKQIKRFSASQLLATLSP